MSDLTAKEQRHVRTALKFLRFRVGGWKAVAEALHLKEDSVQKVAAGGAVSVNLAFRLARLAEISVDDLLAGAWLSPRVCPHCGRPPEDFEDEETVVEDGERNATLKLVK